MRLTHIKLAGFKSFVDPTTIHLPGQLVGIVGPNGCGKSNVIDAVRWVLGESSARHLRGESMQDVLFNGSGGRKPVSRASVELVFDNSLGRAHGQWSAYAEISVKRVLDRNGDSNYYINNIHVRRRDVTDMFLGTGLGPRAYAIIEQGTVSRIVEAKPEELRVFLEEAAGVSIYKERRRETELRLRDTRENLLRVEDIRQELATQLEKLTAQAEVARRYHALSAQLEDQQHLLWYCRWRDAEQASSRMTAEVARLGVELEAEQARAAELEARLAALRDEHFQAAEAVHAAQAELYAVNAEVARLEQDIRTSREAREKLLARIAALEAETVRQENQRRETEAQLEVSRARLSEAEEAARAALEAASSARAGLPQVNAAFGEAERRHAELSRQLAETTQARSVEEAHLVHARKALADLAARETRLTEERSRLARPDELKLAALKAEVEERSQRLEAARTELAALHARQPVLERAVREADRRVQEGVRDIAALEARLKALEQTQAAVDHDEKLARWLERHGLTEARRLWQCLDIDPGWDVALEGVLGGRVRAVVMDDLAPACAWLSEPPPAGMAVAASGGTPVASPAPPGLEPLSTYVRWKGEGGAVLAEWLAGVYAVADCREAWARAAELAPGEVIVCQAGHVIGRCGVRFHGEQSALHGVLQRQREIEDLREEIARRKAALPEREAAVEAAEASLAEVKTAASRAANEIARMQQELHHRQMELQKLAQLAAQVDERAQRIQAELAEIATLRAREAEEEARAEARLAELRGRLEDLLEHVQDAKQERDRAAALLEASRGEVANRERAAQEAEFAAKSAAAKVAELENWLRLSVDQAERILQEKQRLVEELAGLDETPARSALEAKLEQRKAAETALADSRDRLAHVAERLAEAERERLATEHRLHPLRERIEQARLKEQEARLAAKQAESQLSEAGADVARLSERAGQGLRPEALQREITRLKTEIEALGPVNLAALAELEDAQARKAYLDAQAADLAQAMSTLENAIARIDRETRERLKETFETVNGYFRELFPAVFRGGHAELRLTGDNLLDAGVQIVAQPPGKRNNSLHLLSGGEKALTALALVFALFRLNPAPFCLLDEVDAPLDDANTGRYCELVRRMSEHTQFVFVTHNKITMEMAQQLIGVTMPEPGVSRIVAVDVENAMKMQAKALQAVG